MRRKDEGWILPSWFFSVLVALYAVGAASSFAQIARPLSLDPSPGIHVYSYDGKAHRSAEHYTALRRVVLQEFRLPEDSVSIDLVFIDPQLRETLYTNNRGRFQSAEWCGAFITPTLIFMLGDEESDDTFMHEYMHSLQDRGVLFHDVHASTVHQLIEKNEGLLLGSKSYLEYLKAKR